ncbi:hypothetical protein HF522_05860 [Lacticaseibacillus rhamnosus]|nr:hypothetical protein HF522_05860 [Lacticaseibacillus rhamnosus]CAR88239.1 Conserved protein [Lacticaseibacillus rhamnosus GG]
MTRSPAQKSACKDLRRNGRSPTITPQATYTPTSNRAGSRSYQKSCQGSAASRRIFSLIFNWSQNVCIFRMIMECMHGIGT